MRRKVRNYGFLSKFTYYVPGVGGMFSLLLWLLVGALVGNLLSLLMVKFMGTGAGMEYSTLVSYPVMFIPPMIAASVMSGRAGLNQKGYRLDNGHFSPLGAALCVLLVILGTVATGVVAEAAGSFLPEMPDWLKDVLESMTNGTLWVNFICVCIFAPFFEEWLCRGMILRGLLGNGMKPVWAIVISAAFFAFIHLNPWQAIPAFLLGCLFGYVYYKTGSLKLTMLMHFINNGLALLLSNLDSLEGAETYRDLFPGGIYWIVLAACVILVALVVLQFKRIPLQSSKGNCDETPSLFEQE